MLPPPDISAAYVDDQRRPSKDFYNWIKSLDTSVRSGSTGSNAWVNVKDYGATGDGETDDTAGIQAAIDAATDDICWVYFPRGIYYVTSALIINGYCNLVGAGMNAVVISAGQNAGGSPYNDITVLVVLGQNVTVSDLSLRGKGGWQDTGSFGASNPTLYADGGENTYRKMRIDGGTQCIDVHGYDHLFDDLVINSAYEELLRVNESGQFFRRIKADSGDTTNSVDQSWPVRANSTHYNAGDMVKNNVGGHNCVLSCTQSGTTGGSAPTNQNYGIEFDDGSAKWRLSAPVGLNCIECFTNGTDGEECHFEQIDLSGDFANSLHVDDQSGGDLAFVSFVQSIFSAKISIDSARWCGFNSCEMPSSIATSNKDVTIVGCKAQTPVTVSGTFTGAGNIGIT